MSGVDARSRIEPKIPHEEPAEMVGTTRPRISAFMKCFRALGLIESTPEHYLIVQETLLPTYVAPLA